MYVYITERTRREPNKIIKFILEFSSQQHLNL